MWVFAIPYEEIICREENILAQTHSKRLIFCLLTHSLSMNSILIFKGLKSTDYILWGYLSPVNVHVHLPNMNKWWELIGIIHIPIQPKCFHFAFVATQTWPVFVTKYGTLTWWFENIRLLLSHSEVWEKTAFAGSWEPLLSFPEASGPPALQVLSSPDMCCKLEHGGRHQGGKYFIYYVLPQTQTQRWLSDGGQYPL